MLDLSTLLDIFLFTNDEDGGYYTDLKTKLADSTSPSVPVTITDEDLLYIGFERPIKHFFVDLTANAVPTTLIFKAWNGTSWEPIDALDETYGFSKSGSIQLMNDDLQEVEVVNKTKYFIQISLAETSSAMALNFIGCLLSTDNDLLIEVPYILGSNFLMEGKANHVNFHIAARNEIVQLFTNQGYVTKSKDRLTYWHILDAQELKQASIFLALSKLYSALADNNDDTWLNKSREFRKLYDKQVNVYRLTLDLNNSGTVDASEKSKQSSSFHLSR